MTCPYCESREVVDCGAVEEDLEPLRVPRLSARLPSGPQVSRFFLEGAFSDTPPRHEVPTEADLSLILLDRELDIMLQRDGVVTFERPNGCDR